MENVSALYRRYPTCRWLFRNHRRRDETDAAARQPQSAVSALFFLSFWQRVVYGFNLGEDGGLCVCLCVLVLMFHISLVNTQFRFKAKGSCGISILVFVVTLTVITRAFVCIADCLVFILGNPCPCLDDTLDGLYLGRFAGCFSRCATRVAGFRRR